MASGRLFDASALVDLLVGTEGRTVDIDVVFDEAILDLTIYETANAVWKIGIALDRLADDDVDEAVALLDKLTREMRIESAVTTDLERAVELARRVGLTVYDAAYLAVAERDELAVVTEDRALRDGCLREEIPVETVADLTG
ncbi:type II toxin-antitoxin system VapC family toxin [Natronorarus salvus]|uniref:type II toxin-antitoxin system VapC family toxin n=1 Tax=Natronorarus salvus TaxID=3117733 RepID=UPI002F267252